MRSVCEQAPKGDFSLVRISHTAENILHNVGDITESALWSRYTHTFVQYNEMLSSRYP